MAWFVFFGLHFSWKISRRIKWGIAFALPVMILNLFKKFVFDIPLFVGTGSAWSMGFTASSTIDHFLMALGDLSGVNIGPNYLVGVSLEAQNINHQIASLGIIFLFGAILLSPILGKHSHCFNSENRLSRSIRLVPILCFIFLGIFMNFYYRTAVDGVYFRSSQIASQSLLNSVKPILDNSIQSENSLYVIDPTPGANWDVALRPIISANTDLRLPTLITVADEADIPNTFAGAVALFYDTATGVLSSREVVITPKFEITGDVFEDGWVGKNLAITNIDKRCTSMQIVFNPKGNWGGNVALLTPSFSEPSLINIKNNEVSATFEPSGETPHIDIQFRNVWIPSEQGTNEDVRALSVALTVTCSQP